MSHRAPDTDDRTAGKHTAARWKHTMHLPKFDRASEEVIDRITASNMHLCKVLSPLVVAAVIAVIIAGWLFHPGLDPSAAKDTLFTIASAVMIIAAVAIGILARRFENGRVTNRHYVVRCLAAYVIIGYAYATIVSTASYYLAGRVSIFYISMLINTILLVFIPPVQLIFTVGATVGLLGALAALGMGSAPLTAGALAFMVATFAAGTMRYREQRRSIVATMAAEKSSLTDGLTGLHNRMSFDNDLYKHTGRPTVIAMTDVDDFKYFNDAYSHEMGDRVLKSFAEALADSFPEASAYRYGGDEFTLIIDVNDTPDFLEQIHTFQHEVANISLGLDEPLRVSASLGYAQGNPVSISEMHNLLHVADRKLYEAKRDGKNRAMGASVENLDPENDGSPASQLPFMRSYELDSLTNLPNMQYFRAHGLQYAAHLRDNKQDPALMHFNLVNFKLVNERQGYSAGDRLLCTTADAIKEAYPGMLAARIAEDRFALICPLADVGPGFMQVRETVNMHKREPAMTLKAGVFVLNGELDDIGDAYDAAKIACDSIKPVHGQSLRLYDDELRIVVERRRYVFDHIAEAIRDNKLVVYYQPVYRALTNRLCGCEALVRWEDDRYGMIPPNEFIGLLEGSQQISALDRYVVTQVCDDWKAIVDAGEPAQPVSVNFSRIDFQLIDVVDLVEESTQRVDMPRQMLHVEVTESAFTDADDRLTDQIARLRHLGYQVWMDDFGSGYSSLNQLEWHDFDVAKIDMAFMRNFKNPQTRSMLASLVDMIKRLGVQTLVEGVETKEQFEFMRAIGCEFIQGYFTGKPMTLADFRALLTGPAETVEPFKQRGYFDAIGRVNPQAQNPTALVASAGGQPQTDPQDLALAIVEWWPNHLRFVGANKPYRELLDYLKISPTESAKKHLTGQAFTPTEHLNALLQSTATARHELTFDFTIHGESCVLGTRHIAEYRGTHAILLTLVDNSRVPGRRIGNKFNLVTRYVYTLYDIIDLVDRSNGIISNVFSKGISLLNPKNDEMALSEASMQYAREYIHPDDRARYLRYIDMDTFDERLSRSDRSYLSDAFRALAPNGSYRWTITLLIPMETKDGNYLVLCRRDAHFDLMDANDKRKNLLSDDLLWDALMRLSSDKIFWKDDRARFTGANRAFLDYYGFDSLGDILGKTDADMGWHLDNDALAQDEHDVLTKGATITGKPGITIARGHARNIVASKAPLKRNGTIRGLMGIFNDVDELRQTNDRAIDLSDTDRMTGLMNGQGIRETLSAFESIRCEKGQNYGVVYLDIDNLRDINREYGTAFGNRVLAKIGEALIGAIETRGVVGRMCSDEFVIVRQFKDAAPKEQKHALQQLATAARDAIAGITSVDASPCHTDASYGYALRSETEGTLSLLTLAESRMRDERHLRLITQPGNYSPLKMTTSDAKRHMEILGRQYDIVRLVDPSTCEARELTSHQELGKPYRCYSVFERDARCYNCICARAMNNHGSYEKCECVGSLQGVMHSQYVEVDGKPYVLETMSELPLDKLLGTAVQNEMAEPGEGAAGSGAADEAAGAGSATSAAGATDARGGAGAGASAADAGADGAAGAHATGAASDSGAASASGVSGQAGRSGQSNNPVWTAVSDAAAEAAAGGTSIKVVGACNGCRAGGSAGGGTGDPGSAAAAAGSANSAGASTGVMVPSRPATGETQPGRIVFKRMSDGNRSTVEEENVLDDTTGAFNPKYLEDTLVHLRSQAVAAIELPAGDDETARVAVQVLKANVRPNDAIVRAAASLLIIVFDGATVPTNLESRLQDIRTQLREANVPGQDEAGISANIGAAQREGEVLELMHEAERNVYRAKADGGVYVTGGAVKAN